MIPYGRHCISEEDIEEVCRVLRSDWITQGPAIERFENAVAEYCGAKYAIAVCNATAALHISALAVGLEKGKKLWTSPNTFVASANCALYCNATVDFIDIDPKSYNISVTALEQKLEQAKTEGKLPDLVVPVHFAGQSCEMRQIHQLSQKYGFKILEDASHAIGGSYQGKKIGSCEFSEITVFSFHPVKIITAGEGGMILTNSEDLYQRLIRLRSHGITRDFDFMLDEHPAPWYYEQIELGLNYRMTDIQAALGRSQLKRIDQFVERRHQLAARYDKELEALPIELPWQDSSNYSSYHLYVIRLKLLDITKSHRQIFELLRIKGIGVNLHYIPVHTQPYYKKLGFQVGDFPIAEQYSREAISIPIYFGLKEIDQDSVISALREVLGS
jgi:UDP-4-amino-4,6-dideoxy-N-acetyl-beta-L-altrosamine transaminase